MSTLTIARKDIEDVVQSRLIWGVFVLFVILMGIIGLASTGDADSEVTTEGFIGLFTNLGAWLMVPLIGIMIGYMAIVGERQSGSLRILFGLGFNRREVLLGKFLSRTGTIIVVTIASLLVMVGLAAVIADSWDTFLFVRFAGLAILLAVMFTAIAVAVSASVSTRYRAMGGTVGAYIVFAMLWHPIAAGIHWVIEGDLPGFNAPEWYFLLIRLNPLEAFNQVTSVWIDQYVWGIIGWVTVVEDVDMTNPDELILTNRVEGDLPFYLSDWFAVIILGLWIVIPLGVAYWRFKRADLN